MTILTLTSLSFLAASKFGYKIAQRRKWLPASFYHLLSIERLKQGDLNAAAQFNAIALQKKPNLDNALVVKDVLAMRRDSLQRDVSRKVQDELLQIMTLQRQQQLARKKIRKLMRKTEQHKAIKTLFLIAIVLFAIFSVVYSFTVTFISPIIPILFLIAVGVYVLLDRTVLEKRRIQHHILLQELNASLSSIQQEIVLRQKRIQELKEKTNFLVH